MVGELETPDRIMDKFWTRPTDGQVTDGNPLKDRLKMASPRDANIEFYTASQCAVNYLNILITMIL